MEIDAKTAQSFKSGCIWEEQRSRGKDSEGQLFFEKYTKYIQEFLNFVSI